jgi:hypothetical protein
MCPNWYRALPECSSVIDRLHLQSVFDDNQPRSDPQPVPPDQPSSSGLRGHTLAAESLGNGDKPS